MPMFAQAPHFWSKVDVGRPDECWMWMAATTRGYGRIKHAGRLEMAHRLAWELAGGEIPDGLVVDHLCFNRACVNPDHLQLLTREANAARHPENCRCSKHSPELYQLPLCHQGHDLTAPAARLRSGRCRTCMNSHTREYMRRKRAAA